MGYRAYTLEQARHTPAISRVIVSTDDADLFEVAQLRGSGNAARREEYRDLGGLILAQEEQGIRRFFLGQLDRNDVVGKDDARQKFKSRILLPTLRSTISSTRAGHASSLPVAQRGGPPLAGPSIGINGACG